MEQPHAPSALPGGKKSSQTNLSAMQAAAIDEGFLADVSSNSSQLPKPPFLWNPSLWDLGHRLSVSSREETCLRKDPRRGLTVAWVWQTVIWMSVVPSLRKRCNIRDTKPPDFDTKPPCSPHPHFTVSYDASYTYL